MRFEIYNRAGRFLCWQDAENEADAVRFARMYGHRAHHAIQA